MRRNALWKRLIILTHAWLLIFAVTSPALAASGVFLTVTGKVSYTFHRSTQNGRTGLRVAPGARVNSEGGTATILLPDGSAHPLKEGTSFTVPEGGPEESQDAFTVGLMDTIREISIRGKEPPESGVTQVLREIVPVYPHNSFVRPDELHFEWKAAEGAEGYEVILKAPSPVYGYSFAAPPGEARAVLPGGAPPLLPGYKYYWKVRARLGKGEESLTSALCWFALLDSETEEGIRINAEKIRNRHDLDEESKKLLTAALFISNGLYHKGMLLLDERLKTHPDDDGVLELRRGLLRKMNKKVVAEIQGGKP